MIEVLFVLIFHFLLRFSCSSTNLPLFFFFFFNDPATPEISPLSLPDALPIYACGIGYVAVLPGRTLFGIADGTFGPVTKYTLGCNPAGVQTADLDSDGILDLVVSVHGDGRDRKSTRLNSSHLGISYAGFCLTK